MLEISSAGENLALSVRRGGQREFEPLKLAADGRYELPPGEYEVTLLRDGVTHDIRPKRLSIAPGGRTMVTVTRRQQLVFRQPPPEGFRSLFDGRSLKGWRAVPTTPAAYTAADEVLSRQAGEIGGWLLTTETFANFELHLECRAVNVPDLTVGLRYDGAEPAVRVAVSPQSLGRLVGRLPRGEPFDSEPHPQAASVWRPAAWNACDIYCQGSYLRVEVNGEPVNRVQKQSAQSNDTALAAGPIALSTGTARLELRNLWIRPLSAAAAIELDHPLARLDGHTDTPYDLCFSPNGRMLYSSQTKEPPRLWDLAKRKLVRLVKEVPVRDARFAASPDGTSLAVAGEGDVMVSSFDLGNIRTLESPDKQPFRCATWSPDGRWLAAANAKGIVVIWETNEFKQVKQLPTRSSSLFLEFGSGSELLLMGGWAPSIQAWHAGTWERTRGMTHPELEEAVRGAVSPDGRLLTVGPWNENKPVFTWRLSDTKLLSSFQVQHRGAYGLTYSPDGKLLALSDGNSINIYAPPGEQPIARLLGHEAVRIRFSPDGTVLASSGYDNRIWLWNVAEIGSAAH